MVNIQAVLTDICSVFFVTDKKSNKNYLNVMIEQAFDI